MASAPELVHDGDPAGAAASLLAARLAEVARSTAAPRLAIPGGSAIAALGAARELEGAGVPWERVRLTWVDERCVPAASPDSNRGSAIRAGLLENPAPGEVLPLYLDGEDPASSVARVEAALVDRFEGALDVLLLGMGEDGHVASLFPGLPAPTHGRAAHVTGSPKPPTNRITLTLPMLATARYTVLLAVGESKREALVRLRAGDRTLPACGLTNLTVVTDLDL